eukprot:12123_1
MDGICIRFMSKNETLFFKAMNGSISIMELIYSVLFPIDSSSNIGDFYSSNWNERFKARNEDEKVMNPIITAAIYDAKVTKKAERVKVYYYCIHKDQDGNPCGIHSASLCPTEEFKCKHDCIDKTQKIRFIKYRHPKCGCKNNVCCVWLPPIVAVNITTIVPKSLQIPLAIICSRPKLILHPITCKDMTSYYDADFTPLVEDLEQDAATIDLLQMEVNTVVSSGDPSDIGEVLNRSRGMFNLFGIKARPTAEIKKKKSALAFELEAFQRDERNKNKTNDEDNEEMKSDTTSKTIGDLNTEETDDDNDDKPKKSSIKDDVLQTVIPNIIDESIANQNTVKVKTSNEAESFINPVLAQMQVMNANFMKSNELFMNQFHTLVKQQCAMQEIY